MPGEKMKYLNMPGEKMKYLNMPGEKSYVYLDSSKQTNVLNEENARNKNKGFNEIRSCIRKMCTVFHLAKPGFT